VSGKWRVVESRHCQKILELAATLELVDISPFLVAGG
jgi:hypothetical protein